MPKKFTQEEVAEYLKENGYTINNLYKNNNSKISLTCKNNHIWETKLNNFKQGGQRCPYCKKLSIGGGMSSGERMVWTVLQSNKRILNNIKREITVLIEGAKHRFDFMFIYNGTQYVVEYDGQQHFYEPSGVYRGSFATTQKRDLEKDLYCKQNNITLIRIPYYIDTLPKVSQYIGKITRITLVTPDSILSNTIQNVVDHYLLHPIGETMRKFNISYSTVIKYFKLVHGTGKHTYVRQSMIQEVAQYYLTHSSKDTQSKFNISDNTVTTYFYEVFGKTKAAYLGVTPEELAQYYLTHSMDETASKYTVSVKTVTNSFREVFGINKREYLTLHGNILYTPAVTKEDKKKHS